MPVRNCDAWIKVESPVICLDKEPDAGGRAFGIGELYSEPGTLTTPGPFPAVAPGGTVRQDRMDLLA